MKWKDTGEMEEKDTTTEEEEYFDEEQYSPWADQENQKKGGFLNKTKALFGLLLGAIIALVIALLVLIVGGSTGGVSPQQLAQFEERLQNLEERLDKFEAIDEKVTRIWEQAKAFETFKDRFERSEASMSLRMDHLTMSLETMQKLFSEAQAPVGAAPAPTKDKVPKTAPTTSAKIQYHQVQAGDTLYSISKKYNLGVDQLLQMNKMKPGSVIQPGQKLIVRQP
ncbi:MAG: LysM domain-containing protein [Desulfobacteraceae bacterium]